ncbi:MAG: type IV pilus modification PilV family protein [Steroidobacteraceae bacterium]
MFLSELHGRPGLRGQTLVETLIACLVLAVALAGFTQALVGALATEREATTRLLALRHAEAAAEHLRLLRGLDPARRADRLAELDAGLREGVGQELPSGAQAGLGELESAGGVYRIHIGWPTRGAGQQEVLLWVR